MSVTVVIPVGPYHRDLVNRAIASVENQTIPVKHIVVYDDDGNGPGWARNQGLQQVTTAYVLFLDADDWLEPDAIESLLNVAKQHPTRYIYSDWMRDNILIETPPTGFAWCGGTWHPISALIPTNWARDVGGFDETMKGGEDTDFYLKLSTTMRCGLRLEKPLVHYSPDGKRAKAFHESADFKHIMKKMSEKYGGKMACCGKNADVDNMPVGQRQPGDVLAAALWGGNRVEMGRATGRRYPRTGNGKRVWVDPRDIKAAPQLWMEVPSVEHTPDDLPKKQVNPAQNVYDLARAAMPRFGNQGIEQYKIDHGQPRQTAPDVAAIIRMGQEAVR